MKRLDELDYVPPEWSKRLEEEDWITTAGDLLSNCRIPGGIQRLAQTLGTTAAAVAEGAAKLSEELGEDSVRLAGGVSVELNKEDPRRKQYAKG